MTLRHDVEVQIEFLATEHGGRQSPARSGYRPQLYYDGHDWDAAHEYPDAESVPPGGHVRAFLSCMSPQFHDGKLVPGKAVLFREGQKVVAFGSVLRVIDLPRAAYAARVSEALDRYHVFLFQLSEGASNEQNKALSKQQVHSSSAIRRQLRDECSTVDLLAFVRDQQLLKASLSAFGPELADALAVLEAAVGDGPPA